MIEKNFWNSRLKAKNWQKCLLIVGQNNIGYKIPFLGFLFFTLWPPWFCLPKKIKINVKTKCSPINEISHIIKPLWLVSRTMEVKNNYAHVTTQRILNKFIGINFSVGCMVWPWCCLFQPELPVKILMRLILQAC